MEINNMGKIVSYWKEVNNQISRLIPGIQLEDLLVYSKKWWKMALNIHTIGTFWEKLITSSLAVKYYLHQLDSPGEYLPLTKIYKLSNSAQAYPLLTLFSVNLSEGVIVPEKEVTVRDILSKAIYHNSQQNAHHDIILSANPNNIAIQCKYSFYDPGGDAISSQLVGCKYLLWFYLGCDEDSSDAPKNYKTEMVISALKENQLGFLNGAGCASPLSIDLLILLKEIVLQRLLPTQGTQ